MKAAVWYKKGDMRFEDIPKPEPKSGEVRLKVKACGICGSDLHEYKAGPFIIPRKPHPITKREGGPVVLGHEFSAVVDSLGEGIKTVKPGDRVTVNPLIYCGECPFCRKGQLNMCIKLGTAGFASDGGFAEYTVVPEYALFHLPDELNDDAGAFVEPLAVAVRAVKRSRLQLGQSVAVIGAGPIGLLVMQVCKAAGASQVFVVEPMAARRELAARLGATQVFDPTTTDPGRVIGELTNRMRADVAIDCVGSQSSFDTAVKCTGRRAVICVAGLSLKPIEVPFLKLWGHEKEITFMTGYENEFPAAIALLANGQVNIEELVTARIGLSNILEDGIDALINHGDKHIKILVYPEKG